MTESSPTHKIRPTYSAVSNRISSGIGLSATFFKPLRQRWWRKLLIQ